MKAWYPSKRRRTYIKSHHIPAWWQAVHDSENTTHRDFLLLMLFTGLRRSEASALTWSNIDFVDRTLSIYKTKNGDPLNLPLSDFVYGLLKERHESDGGEGFVFPGSGKHGFMHEPKKSIQKVRAQCGIEFTCQDLRRSYVTYAESLDIPYYTLKLLINHKVHDVTAGYVVINVERLREPVQRISNFILKALHAL